MTAMMRFYRPQGINGNYTLVLESIGGRAENLAVTWSLPEPARPDPA